MQYLVEKAIYEPVAMYFRNPYVQEYEECPDAVFDVYHMRNISEGVNSYMKNKLGLETHVNGEGYEEYRPSCDPVLHSFTCCCLDQITAWD